MSDEQDFSKLSADEAAEVLVGCCHRMSLAVHAVTRWTRRTKPIYGGPFGRAGFVLMSVTRSNQGLDETVYCAAHESGFLLGIEDTRAEALQTGRMALSFLSHARLTRAVEEFKAAEAEQRKRLFQEAEIERYKWMERLRQQRAAEAQAESTVPQASVVKSIPRRRRQIFDEAGGKCHYCGTALTLDGTWHAEHKFPKALGGTNERNNLVASCAPCNHAKRDRTDIEFKAKRAAEGSPA